MSLYKHCLITRGTIPIFLEVLVRQNYRLLSTARPPKCGLLLYVSKECDHKSSYISSHNMFNICLIFIRSISSVSGVQIQI